MRHGGGGELLLLLLLMVGGSGPWALVHACAAAVSILSLKLPPRWAPFLPDSFEPTILFSFLRTPLTCALPPPPALPLLLHTPCHRPPRAVAVNVGVSQAAERAVIANSATSRTTTGSALSFNEVNAALSKQSSGTSSADATTTTGQAAAFGLAQAIGGVHADSQGASSATTSTGTCAAAGGGAAAAANCVRFPTLPTDNLCVDLSCVLPSPQWSAQAQPSRASTCHYQPPD